MLNLYYHELIGKVKEDPRKNYLMVDEKNKKIIGIEKFDNTKMLIDTDDKLREDIT